MRLEVRTAELLSGSVSIAVLDSEPSQSECENIAAGHFLKEPVEVLNAAGVDAWEPWKRWLPELQQPGNQDPGEPIVSAIVDS